MITVALYAPATIFALHSRSIWIVAGVRQSSRYYDGFRRRVLFTVFRVRWLFRRLGLLPVFFPRICCSKPGKSKPNNSAILALSSGQNEALADVGQLVNDTVSKARKL
jgi:hypothetical protein